ncbi:hypothetical protein ABEY50_27560 [Priestia megaterium]|jgi:hypothetical protein|uniref:hypothetical protein n=1 Tax=Priestia TaxID=2800373 RepID=UPI00203AC08F|nr:hypothetical protein [Priestia megaterium]MCM3186812.1 hypothetical protein [Priestia megaterium]MEC1071384.1 hypothetical protein [Priestia megaterium]
MLDLLNSVDVTQLTSHLTLGAADGMNSLIESGKSIIKWAQRGAIVATALAFIVGGYFLILGGDKGRHKCIAWFVGGSLGLIVVMGAYALADGVNSNVRFGG